MFSNPYHALQYRSAIHQYAKAILVVSVQIVDLRVHEIQAWFMNAKFAIASKCEVPAHTKIGNPLTRLPCPENAVVVSYPAVTSVLVLR